MDTKATVSLDDILKERRIEMAFEETTYWDYFRLGTAMEKLNGSTNPLKKIDITIKNGKKTYTVSNLDRRAKNNWIFTEKEYYFPIPWSEIKYQGIEQNPEWSEV